MRASTSLITDSAAASISYPSGQAVTSARMSFRNADRFSFSRRFSAARRPVYPSGQYWAKASTIEDGVAPSWARASQRSNRSRPFDRDAGAGHDDHPEARHLLLRLWIRSDHTSQQLAADARATDSHDTHLFGVFVSELRPNLGESL